MANGCNGKAVSFQDRIVDLKLPTLPFDTGACREWLRGNGYVISWGGEPRHIVERASVGHCSFVGDCFQ